MGGAASHEVTGESNADVPASACPGDDVIVALVEGRLATSDRDALQAHLDGCAACSELVAEFARTFLDDTVMATPAGASDGALGDGQLGDGDVVGRYRISGRLGAGGMGVVYRARDPHLEREVALKVVAAGAQAGADEAQRRLLREARALAKLSHPNVVPAYDVGTTAGGVYVAMEYVRGETLREWSADGPDDEAIMDVLEQAAAGLMAAHDVGLAHRDFKPGNVMVGDDGRVRVVDFGLARIDRDVVDPRSVKGLSGHDTTQGAVMGTPAYMAPEQWRGQRGDARSDQYSFAVTAWELLVGERPFEADDLEGLRDAVLSGELAEPATPKLSVLAKALAVEPSDRYVDMAALMTALHAAVDAERLSTSVAATDAAATDIEPVAASVGRRGPLLRLGWLAVPLLAVGGWLVFSPTAERLAPWPAPAELTDAAARRVSGVVDTRAPRASGELDAASSAEPDRSPTEPQRPDHPAVDPKPPADSTDAADPVGAPAPRPGPRPPIKVGGEVDLRDDALDDRL